MLATKLSPSPYTEPRLLSMSRQRTCDIWTVASSDETLQPMLSDPYATWRDLAPLLEEIEAGRHEFFGPVARIEFIWEESSHSAEAMHGAILFDRSGMTIVHVSNALLGYPGHGPELSHQILTLLGFPDNLFEGMQRSAHDSRPYVIVASRETPSHLVTHEVPMITHDEPLRDWSWWRFR